ncbi:thiopurine S-methyltransferase [Lactobacillus delbrueckii subsp. bulgaricus]|nr:thiopurine S-methyltransferase [Lactobacillus delbrueckii subsp. bulgaricus]MBT8919547.1 thiopurine S-methyltransferase [Lactobacillus delbrueckii subsp. bulgaricus]MBT8986466.1 thiopurine S-methyltransferase [Lactobacillus delbrueckii subsp. bulgaricus]
MRNLYPRGGLAASFFMFYAALPPPFGIFFLSLERGKKQFFPMKIVIA